MYNITQIIVTINLHAKDKLEIFRLYNVLDLHNYNVDSLETRSCEIVRTYLSSFDLRVKT
jgi:hypothetical protein